MKTSPRPLLLVDDTHDDLILLRLLLRKAAITNPITAAEDGVIAQRLLQASASDPVLLPALVFTDLQMAGTDGLSLVKWARSRREFDNVKFVILTSALAPADSRAATAAGASGCFEKFPSISILANFVSSVQLGILVLIQQFAF